MVMLICARVRQQMRAETRIAVRANLMAEGRYQETLDS